MKTANEFCTDIRNDASLFEDHNNIEHKNLDTPKPGEEDNIDNNNTDNNNNPDDNDTSNDRSIVPSTLPTQPGGKPKA